MSRDRFNLLDFNLSPGFRVIEAGAGSGKTYNLVRIVLRLLTREHDPLPIREILLVTFTEAAALEMRQRLRTILEESLRPNLKGDLAEIMVKSGNKRRVQRALDEIGTMQVTTIHGFCWRAYSDHAVNCGFPPSIGEPQDGTQLMSEIAADWYRTKQDSKLKLSTIEAAAKALVMCPNAEIDPNLEGLREYVSQRLQSAPFVTFDYLISRLKYALQDSVKGPKISEFLQKDYRACLIDESQDTDPSQWYIFNRLFGPAAATGKHLLLMVGDPKQSIYGFRGADVRTYCNAIKEADTIQTLPDNYRSSLRMIEAFNLLFKHKEFFGTTEITYDIAGSSKSENEIAEVTSTPFEIVYSDKPAAVAREAIRLLHELDAAKIRRCGKTLDNCKPRESEELAEVGILVRSNSYADKIYRALIAAGQGASLESRQSVFETTTAFQVQLLLRAVLRPSHAGNRKALLLSRPSLFGESAELNDETDNTIAAWLNKCLILWRKHGFALAWETLTHQSPGENLNSIIEGLGQCQFRHRALMDLSHIGELLITRNRTLHWTPEQLFDHLSARVRSENDGEMEESEASEEECIRADLANSRILVRTIHKSKGLEYNAVILANSFQYRKAPVRQGTILRLDNGEAKVYSGDADVKTQLERQQRQEDARLLYVALTRARHRFVWMGIEKPIPDRYGKIGDPGGFSQVLKDVGLNPSLVFQSLPSDIKEYVLPLVPLGVDNDLAKPIPSPLFVPELGKIPEKRPHFAYGDTSYTKLSKHTSVKNDNENQNSITPGMDEPEDKIQPKPSTSLLIPDNLKGALLGTFLHKVLEVLDFKKAVKDHEYLKVTTERLLACSGLMSAEDKEFQNTVSFISKSILIWLKQNLSTHEGKPFCLADIDLGTQLAEVRFAFATEINNKTIVNINQVFEAALVDDKDKTCLKKLDLSDKKTSNVDGLIIGSVDYIFEKDNRYYIVDWKSNYLGDSPEDYTPKNLAKAIANERYHLQFSLYTLALNQHLGLCLGDKWDYERDFGGVYYIYLRGFGTHTGADHGAFFHRPSLKFINELGEILKPKTNII